MPLMTVVAHTECSGPSSFARKGSRPRAGWLSRSEYIGGVTCALNQTEGGCKDVLYLLVGGDHCHRHVFPL